jgi:hypothetical protein
MFMLTNSLWYRAMRVDELENDLAHLGEALEIAEKASENALENARREHAEVGWLVDG